MTINNNQILLYQALLEILDSTVLFEYKTKEGGMWKTVLLQYEQS